MATVLVKVVVVGAAHQSRRLVEDTKQKVHLDLVEGYHVFLLTNRMVQGGRRRPNSTGRPSKAASTEEFNTT